MSIIENVKLITHMGFTTTYLADRYYPSSKTCSKYNLIKSDLNASMNLFNYIA